MVKLTRPHVADVTEVSGTGYEFPSSGGGGGGGRRSRRLRDLCEHLKAFAGPEVRDVVEVHRRRDQLLAIRARSARGSFASCKDMALIVH